MEIKNVLKLLRKKKKITQEQLAKELNISRGAYAKYETGINTPPTNVIISLSIFFGVTTDYIMGRYKDEEYK